MIDVPAYCVTDWGDHGLHTRGTIEAWRELSSEHKWLEVHGRKKWQYYYRPESLRRQQAFFDHFLKSADDEVESGRPCASRSANATTRASSAPSASGPWPAPRIAVRAKRGRRQPGPGAAGRRSVGPYDPTPRRASRLRPQFTTRTEITGYSKLRLWVESDESDDIDLFVAL